MSAVEASDLFRLYASPEGTSVALQGLTLDVEEGELLVVFGPSGSGKSTLLRILAGLDRPSAGTVSVFGHDLRTLRGRALLEYRSRTLGYADQHYARALAPELTARELVALRLALLGVAAAERERVADRLLERVGLLDRRDALPARALGRPAAARRDLRGARAPAAALHRRRADRRARRRERGADLRADPRRSRTRSARRRSLVQPRSRVGARRRPRRADPRRPRQRREDGDAVVNRGGWVRHPGGTARRRVPRAARARAGRRILVRERASAPDPAAAAARRPGAVVARTRRPCEGLRRASTSSAT